MKYLLIIISIIGLLLTTLPAFLVFSGIVSAEQNKLLMATGMGCWFVSAPFWINRIKPK